MNKLIMFVILLNAVSHGNEFLKEGTFKTTYYYTANLKIAEKRAKECQTLNEMTFAIERDCENAKNVLKCSKRRKSTSDFIHKSFL